MSSTQILSNVDIRNLSRLLKIHVTCISKDQLARLSPTSSYVLNMQDSSQGGSHWVALYVQNFTKRACYFDPFGLSAPVEVIYWCRKHALFLAVNTMQVQDIPQVCCGWYCLAFIHFMTQDPRANVRVLLNEFLSMFNSVDQSGNDNVLQRYFSRLNII